MNKKEAQECFIIFFIWVEDRKAHVEVRAQLVEAGYLPLLCRFQGSNSVLSDLAASPFIIEPSC